MPALLSSVALVAAAILVYDRWIRPAETPGYHLGIDEGAAPPATPSPRADAGRRIAALEEELSVLRAEVARLSEPGAEPAGVGAGGVTASREPLDERELEVLRLQMEEIARRREAERQRRTVARKLEQLGVEFEPGERDAVLSRMVAHEVAVAAMWTRVREEALADPARIAAEFESLREEAVRDVRRLLPAPKAQAVVKGFLETPAPR